MRIFEIIKENVNLREAAELYGIDVNRYGKALCPFHNDRHPSLYVADDHYYCFACGEHGDVIDFVGKLFQLSPYDAARKLMADFHLSPDKPPSAAALHAKRIRTEAQQLIPCAGSFGCQRIHVALNKHDDKLDRLEEICFMEKLITRKEAAEILGISIATLDAARNNGLISYVQYVQNGCVYFTSAGLQEYIAKCTHRAIHTAFALAGSV